MQCEVLEEAQDGHWDMGWGAGLPLRPPVLVGVSIAVIKHHNKEKLERKGFVSASSHS